MKRPINPANKPDEADLELMKDLERQTVDEIRKLRAFERLDLRINLEVRPGNASQWSVDPIAATTSDLSSGGCAAISPVPLGVGDVYRLEFDREQMKLPIVFARCVRCRLLREDAFEIAMAFFNPVQLSKEKPAATKSLLD